MKGDFTRVTDRNFVKGYTDVLRQQGRVDLDADWNEQVALRDRLARITATDFIGPAGTPEKDGGFAVGVSADGSDLTLSPGRIYVNGILCELKAEAAYTAQPFLPLPEPLTEGDDIVAGRTDLVYLDVWKRHVSAVEDAELLDPVLNGLDTTTRVQTVWQLRVVKGVGEVGCGEVEGFPPVASGGRLTNGAVATPSEADPCAVVVAGGYRGIENRLYRVEIHDPGEMGSATWKWSRDNGAVVFAVEEFIAAPANQLRLRSLGRDAVLTLRQDDWVEILDDASELGFTPGFMARVANVNPATRVVTLDRDAPPDTFEVTRNARVRRWDQVLGVDGDGLLATGAGPFDLEDGVQVRFAGDDFRTGDYWSFAARTAGGAIEARTDAPPEGIQHHYAPLALVRWAESDETVTASVVEDCRATFPPLTGICADDVCYDNSSCDLRADTVQQAIEALCQRDSHPAGGGLCTITLGVGGVADLQQAVDELPLEGGCICIPAGTFVQRRPVAIQGRRAITMHGCGAASVVAYEATEPPLFTIDRTTDISLHSFAIRCAGTGVVSLRASSRIRTFHCSIDCPQGIAFEARGDVDDLIVKECLVSAREAFVFAEGSSLHRVSVQGNLLQASERIVQSFAGRLVDVQMDGNTIEGADLFFETIPEGADVTIARNRMTCRERAAVHCIVMEGRALLTLTENRIGSLENPAAQGVVIEKGMAPEATLVLQGNQLTTVAEALSVRDPENRGELQVSANVFRSLRSVPVVFVGGNVDLEPGIAHVLFNNNQVYTEGLPEEHCTVELNAQRLVVLGNYVADRREGDPRKRSICLPRDALAATVIGNVSRNGVNLEGTSTATVIVVNNAVF